MNNLAGDGEPRDQDEIDILLKMKEMKILPLGLGHGW